MSVDLIELLTAAMDETTRIAVEAGGGTWQVLDDTRYPTGMWSDCPVATFVGLGAEHAVHNNPARVLDKVAADREILAELQRELADDATNETMLWFLRTLAKGYGIDTSATAEV